MATPQEHRVGELMRSFLEHDGLQEVHSFEKAWTIRDAEGNEVEWGEGGDDEAGAGGLGRWPARRGARAAQAPWMLLARSVFG